MSLPQARIVLGVVIAGLTTLGTIVVSVLAETHILIGMAEDADAVTVTFALWFVALLALERHWTPSTISLPADAGNEKRDSLFALR